jgi:ribokinase
MGKKERQPRIIVVGSSNTDMIIKAERIPHPGETVLGGAFQMAAGGKGANQAVAAARAGGHVTFIARVGNDDFGRAAIAGFRREGIDIKYVLKTSQAASGIALIMVDRRGENSIAVAPGANARLSQDNVRKATRAFRAGDILLVQLETPIDTVRAAVRAARGRGLRVILNPAPARELNDALLANVDILTPNETEAELLTGTKIRTKHDMARAARTLRDRGVGSVLITLGARGAFLSDGKADRLLPGFKVKAVDTTAAGDVFNGALAVALAEGRTLKAAARFANAAAAISVTRLGAQPSAPRRIEIERFLGTHLRRIEEHARNGRRKDGRHETRRC